LSVGSSSILHHSSELESSFGKKATQHTLPSKKPKNKCMITLNSTSSFTRSSWLFQFVKVSRQSLKNSQEDCKLLLSKLGFQKTEELFKQQLPTISAKTSQKCSKLNLKIRRKRRNSFGKQVGVLLLVQSEL